MSDWDRLHREHRHQLRWPSEHVVRFLAGLSHVGAAVDIGCGAGRHVKLLRDYSPSISCCDLSETALQWVRLSTGVTGDVAPSTDLPYDDNSFDTAIAYGVFYYGRRHIHERSVAELWRTLKPGGHAFVQTRSPADWRTKHMQAGRFVCDGEPETGMLMHFLHESDIPGLYRSFGSVNYESATTSRRQRQRVDSDWLIEVTK